MATNKVNEGETIKAAVPSGIVSGDAVLIGASGNAGIPAVALTDRDASGNAICDTEGVFDLPVVAKKDVETSGGYEDANEAVAIGDKLYITDATTTPVISKRSLQGKLFGKALEGVTSGATATINVKLIDA